MSQNDGASVPQRRPGQAAQEVTELSSGGYRVNLRRDGRSVEITLTASDDYDSMELFDSLLQSVRKGCLRLEVKLNRGS